MKQRAMELRMKECLLFCLLITYLKFSWCANKCATSNGAMINRNFFVGEHNLPIRIEVSKRISHQLVSNIAKYLLNEALGYKDVFLVDQETDDTVRTLQKMSACKTPSFRDCRLVDETGPEVMINLELWLHPGFNLQQWINTRRVEDCGPLGPIGRAAWFIEKRIVDFMWNQNETIVDHYKSFLNPEVTAKFDLSSDLYVSNKAQKTCNKPEDREKYGCGADGFYRPPQCQNKTVECATILSDYPESTFNSLTNMILRYNLLINIAWLGDEFENLLMKMIDQTKISERRNILFFHKEPMILNGVTNFTHVKFPACEDDLLECDFEVNQLQKVVWSEINASAPLAFQFIRAMSFTQDQYNSLLDSYYKAKNRRHTVEVVACEWVYYNQYIWTPWIPVDAESKTTLYIGGIFPENGVYWEKKALIEVVNMAAKAINNNSTLLRNYDLEVLHSGGRCTTDQVMKSFIHYVKSDIYKTMVGILGPACSNTLEPIVGLAKHFNTIIMSYSAEGSLFNNKETEDKYRLFIRTIPENSFFSPTYNIYRNFYRQKLPPCRARVFENENRRDTVVFNTAFRRFVYIKLFKELNYSRVAALTEEGQKHQQYLSYLQDLMKSHGMTFIENKRFPHERAFSDMSFYLDDLNKKGAKIIIGDFYDYAARSVMCTASKLRMTAINGYLWFLPSWFPADWYDTEVYNNRNNGTENVSCTKEEMVKAINGHMSFSFKYFADNESIMQEQITVKKWREYYKRKLRRNSTISNYAGYAYDAVWVYALALNELLKENSSHVATLHSDRTSKRFVQLLQRTRFNGVSGPLLFQNGNRISAVMIWQWIDKKHHLIGEYEVMSLDDGKLKLYPNKIKWLTPDGKQPADFNKEENEYCDIENFRSLLLHASIKCETLKIVALVICFGVVLCIVIICISAYKRRYDERIKATVNKIMALGYFTKGDLCGPDEWEVSRDQIVMNRILGEGAFGTVYGGEAYIENKGWIAVAVKTLKSGFKREEKLDFLGEAEVMKQFDHINIVKLVGVCTTEEPIFVIMEFMLYGDLKMYLLSRRHMASERDRSNNDEVSNRRLTNMALDIARGLSYLADKKFVHRDLACRNCLVNSSKSVKIADFGMCRAMYDKEYYRFTKKGLLPIRWMAPESVIDGLFSPMSDVWSYGVVLYEIITFASYPYQGLSQAQVLEHLKNRKTLPVPNGCKPVLEALLRQCWSIDPTDRPQAAGIVELLALDLELITPCLDIPIANMGLNDDPETPHTFNRARIRSFSSLWQSRRCVAPLEPNHPRDFDTEQLHQAGLETVECVTSL